MSQPSSPRRLISIVIPAYDEESCVAELARRLQAVFESLPAYDFEVIAVDNGSVDRTFELLNQIQADDDRFKVVQLSRNFGADGGVTAGLRYAHGDAAVIMSADLQDPPELIPRFVEKWEEGYENVYGIVSERRGTGLLRRVNTQAFYWLIGRLAEQPIPRNASDFRLVTRDVYETVNQMREQGRLMRGLFAWVGYRSIGIEHERPERYGGESKANTMHVVKLALNGIMASSTVPLRVIPVLGLGMAALSILALVYVTVTYAVSGLPFQGFGTIVGMSLLLFGILFFCLGIMAQYIGFIHEEVKMRPNFVVRRTVGLDARGGEREHRG